MTPGIALRYLLNRSMMHTKLSSQRSGAQMISDMLAQCFSLLDRAFDLGHICLRQFSPRQL
jgi:hypothetical protein